MHVNTLTSCLFKIHLFAADHLELFQTTRILESREVLRKAKMEGLAELAVLS